MKKSSLSAIALALMILSACGPAKSVETAAVPSPAGATPALTPTRTPTITPVPTLTSTPRAAPPAGALNLRKEFVGVENPSGYVGPDVTIAAGPQVLVVATNSTAAILDKDGNIL